MFRNRLWNVIQFMAAADGAAAEIHILEPKRTKSFIEAAQFLPNRSRHHQKRPGRLFHLNLHIVIHIQATIPPVGRVIWPDSV
jgi:hypothetical protein